MLVGLSETTDLVLTQLHLEVGLEILEKLETNLPKVFEGMGRNELAPVAARMVDLLEMAGQPVPEKKVVAEFFRDADTRELYGVISHLVTIGTLVHLEEKDVNGTVTARLLATARIGRDWVENAKRVTTGG